MSERFRPHAQENIIRDKYERMADAEHLSAIRDDLMAVSIALAPILQAYPHAKTDLHAAIDRCTVGIVGKIGRTFIDF